MTYLLHVTAEKGTMNFHIWHTQTNKALNTLVELYAPKTKNICKTMYLATRVGIVAGVMIMNYAKLWKMIYEELGLKIDLALLKSLRSCDRKKTTKAVVQKITSRKKR